MTITLTNHGYERMKKRTHFAPSQFLSIAEEAYYCGKDIDDFPKETRRYLKNVLEGSTGDYLKVLGNIIYIFGNGCLITVFSFPNKILSKNGRK